jgi:hypothetical protein
VTSESVYIVLSCRQIGDKLSKLIDRGMMTEANRLSQNLKSFYDEVESFAQNCGGHLHLHLYEKSVLELPSTRADQMVEFSEEFEKRFHYKLAMGIGLSMLEASEAAERSESTGEIELYGSELDEEAASKPKEDKPLSNVFDPVQPEEPDYALPEPQPAAPPKSLSPEQAAQGNAALIQAMAQELGFNPNPPQPPATPPSQAEVQGGAQQQPEPEQKEEVDEQESDPVGDRLAQTLHTVHEKIPQIMALADKNPAAFKATMNMVNKLVAVAKQHQSKKKVQKSKLTKDQDVKKAAHVETPVPHAAPIGTQFNGKKKVLVGGRARWRSMRSGQVKDQNGAPISVKEINAESEAKADGKA